MLIRVHMPLCLMQHANSELCPKITLTNLRALIALSILWMYIKYCVYILYVLLFCNSRPRCDFDVNVDYGFRHIFSSDSASVIET